MATRVFDRPATTSPDPWAAAPVAVGRPRHRKQWGLLVVLLIVAGAFAFLAGRQAPLTSTSTPAGREPPLPRAQGSVPFAVAVEVTEVTSMDNDRLFGHDTENHEGAAEAAAQQVGDVLAAYLDAEFVAPGTRFLDLPLDDLLSRRAQAALSGDDLAGLGVLGVSAGQVRGEPVAVTAQVLTSGPDAVAVVVRYDARAQLTTDDGDAVPLRQRATMVFVPEDGQWRAEAVDAALDLPLGTGEVAR